MAAKRSKVTFVSNGHELAGMLETPENSARGYALFAHCFTCGKDVAAASRISRALVNIGFAVFRFDFTGLGNSDGDFANTNFSSNVQDLVAAADFLRDNYEAPLLLIGHSLGGRAVISAARQIPEVAAVATIGAPADAEHVSKQFSAHIETIEAEGEAELTLAGRPFTIKKQFLDDIREENDDIENLRVPLLVMHSPIDNIVLIKEAEKIYTRAKHPKSFVTLDTADHLLTNKDDAQYVAEMIAAWSHRYIDRAAPIRDAEEGVKRGEVLVHEHNKQFTRTIQTDHHQWFADEPVDYNGDNLGPDPYEHVLAGLGACTSMTLRMYANRKKLPLDDVKVTLRHSRHHGEDCEHCDEDNAKVEVMSREIELFGDLTDDERQRLLEIADKCPVHKTLEGKIVITTALKEK
ncbi:bifunctional alpha/beta hydrolase/OsmC family protein [Enterovibrio paralichthyis]|uniref:bifunctional alpha/beta hydrolase/OsmC family protein n=1 Tax=Enterovibrio paralichthyis TaxID=2853805 RepID=UPI001C46B226|nr:bifunctional alpha/beta hydrolase/OsmC family protein [Enterovibrio paralichthyis]MBV7299494.1 alpha/beta fold hydrolase [Enterovibrio paralichthyis]